MRPIWDRIPVPARIAVGAVALVVAPLLIGMETVGGDADLLYRPIKAELVRALRAGTLPTWSDRFGLGVPLLAESHVAAFYPPNLVLYGLLGVVAAYRLSMWLHVVALAATTYLYARRIGLTDRGAALASVSFSLCGFQAVHAVHEPFFTLMPYLPLVLLLADLYAEAGRARWLALLALAWGAQLTLGHFQIQAWTGGLALLTGTWRVLADRRPWPRIVALMAGLGWGLAVAAAQLGPTWELTRVAGFGRPFEHLVRYNLPPSHWAQPALPAMFLGPVRDAVGPYWSSMATMPGEACFYVGTITLVLACVGLVGDGSPRYRTLRPWRVVVVASFALAILPRLWPEGYWLVTRLPGFGWFRCSSRYTLLTSLGLALLAGRGLDRSIPASRSRVGLALAMAFGLAAVSSTAWQWTHRADYRAELGPSTLPLRLGSIALAWVVAGAALIARGRVAADDRGGGTGRGRRLAEAAPILAAAVELATLYYAVDTGWGWPAPPAADGPVARRLAEEPGVGLVAGGMSDLLVAAGLTPAYPYLGITPPPPNYLLEPAGLAEEPADPVARRWMRRFGVTHAVRQAGGDRGRAEVIFEGSDPSLDRTLPEPSSRPAVATWRILRYEGAFPAAWAATKAVVVENWYRLYPRLSAADLPDEATYEEGDRPPDDPGPRARSARVVRWDGREAVVEHDGTCDLVLRRTHYPGWLARIDDGPEAPVGRACGGLQAVRLPGRGTSTVKFRYMPTSGKVGGRVSIVAILGAVLVLAVHADSKVMRLGL